MVGLCRMEKGDAAGAVQAYGRALRSDYLTPEAARALHYDLAHAHEAAGDREAALWYLQKVMKADPRYRDVAAEVTRLGGGAGRPPAGDTTPRPAPGAAVLGAAPAAGGGPKKNIGYV
jgi:predicted TPR repeat methyltransferase